MFGKPFFAVTTKIEEVNSYYDAEQTADEHTDTAVVASGGCWGEPDANDMNASVKPYMNSSSVSGIDMHMHMHMAPWDPDRGRQSEEHTTNTSIRGTAGGWPVWPVWPMDNYHLSLQYPPSFDTSTVRVSTPHESTLYPAYHASSSDCSTSTGRATEASDIRKHQHDDFHQTVFNKNVTSSRNYHHSATIHSANTQFLGMPPYELAASSSSGMTCPPAKKLRSSITCLPPKKGVRRRGKINSLTDLSVSRHSSACPESMMATSCTTATSVPESFAEEESNADDAGSGIKLLHYHHDHQPCASSTTTTTTTTTSTTTTTTTSPSPSASWIDTIQILEPSDRELTTGFTFAVVSQFQACAFSDHDRKGKRTQLSVGFPGLACSHCHDSSARRNGRYFPSTIKTISDSRKTLFAMHQHLKTCNPCPGNVLDNLELLFLGHENERKTETKYGSQRAFFKNIWCRLHGIDPSSMR